MGDAMAPAAKLLLVEADSASLSSLLAAVNTARNYAGVSVVSMSWGGGEFSSEATYDGYFTTPAGHGGVSFVAASGDGGAGAGPEWPSVSPNVLAVGGTTLVADATGNYVSEGGWSGSGGGRSLFEPEPAYQQGVQSSGVRTTPDVALNADPNTGYYVYDSTPYAGQSGWWQVGGTSAAAPQWAALLAIVNQGRVAAGLGLLNSSPASSTLASIYAAANSATFHDVRGGSNGYFAAAGYDMVTGLGTPYANQFVSSLTTPAKAMAQVVAPVAASYTNSLWYRFHLLVEGGRSVAPPPPPTAQSAAVTSAGADVSAEARAAVIADWLDASGAALSISTAPGMRTDATRPSLSNVARELAGGDVPFRDGVETDPAENVDDLATGAAKDGAVAGDPPSHASNTSASRSPLAEDAGPVNVGRTDDATDVIYPSGDDASEASGRPSLPIGLLGITKTDAHWTATVISVIVAAALPSRYNPGFGPLANRVRRWYGGSH